MKQNLYVIFDKVAQEAGPIQCAKNDGIARRMFVQAIKDATFPDDFKILCVGEYDSEEVSFDIYLVPKEILDDVEVEE